MPPGGGREIDKRKREDSRFWILGGNLPESCLVSRGAEYFEIFRRGIPPVEKEMGRVLRFRAENTTVDDFSKCKLSA